MNRVAIALVCLGLASPLLVELGLAVMGAPAGTGRHAVGERQDGQNDNVQRAPHVGWLLRPNHNLKLGFHGQMVEYLSDADGFRIGDPAPAADGKSIVMAGDGKSIVMAGDGKSVVITGDEVMLGMGVQWPDSMAPKLQALLGDGYRVRNMAGAAFGLSQTLLNLRHHILPTRPEAVVVGFTPMGLERSMTAFSERESLNRPAFVVEDSALRPRTAADGPSGALRWLQQHSRIAGLAPKLERRLGRSQGAGAWWEMNRAILDAMRSECEAAGVKLVLMYTPLKAQQPFAVLQAYMKETGAPHVDLLGGALKEPDLFVGGAAYSGRGQGVLAQEAAKALKKLGVGP